MATKELSVLDVLNSSAEELRIEMQNRQIESKGLSKAQMQSELLKIIQHVSRPSSPATVSRVEVSSGLTPEMMLQLEMKKLELEQERENRKLEQEQKRMEQERENKRQVRTRREKNCTRTRT